MWLVAVMDSGTLESGSCLGRPAESFTRALVLGCAFCMVKCTHLREDKQ